MILNKNAKKKVSIKKTPFNQLITSRRAGLSIGYLITYPYAYPMAITQNIDNALSCIDRRLLPKILITSLALNLSFFLKKKTYPLVMKKNQ